MEKELFSSYPDLLTTQNLADILHVSVKTARAMCRDKLVKSVKIGQRVYIPKTEIISLIEKGGCRV